MRTTATAQLAEIQQKLEALPAELAALRRAAKKTCVAEQARIAQAAAAERERLLEQTRREIDMRLRMARRELTEHAAAARGGRRAGSDRADHHARGSAAARRSLLGAAAGGAMTSRAAATRYARALFDVALQKRQDLDQIDRELTGVRRAGARATRTLQRALTHPAIPAARKRAVVEALLSHSPVNPCCWRALLLLLADRDRLALLPELADGVPLAADGSPAGGARRGDDGGGAAGGPGRRRCSRAWRRRPDGQVQLEVRVDPAIVGGAVARIGSTVYDGSVTTQLEKLKQQLVEADTAGELTDARRPQL